MGNFRTKAIDSTTLSDIFTGRNKVTTQEMIEMTSSKGMTIKDFDIVSYATTIKGKEVSVRYPVFCFKEDDTIFYAGGTVLMKMVDNWIADYNGDIRQAREDFISEGGVKIRLEEGDGYIRVVVL